MSKAYVNFFHGSIKLTVYKQTIRPIFEYATPAYSNLNKFHSDQLENLQRQALIACVGAYRHTLHSRHRTSFYPAQVLRPLSFISDHKYSFLPSQFVTSIYSLVNLLSIDLGRNFDCFLIPHTTKSYVLNSFSWNTRQYWNKLSLEIRKAHRLNNLRKVFVLTLELYFTPPTRY